MIVIGIDPSLTGTGIVIGETRLTVHTDSSGPDGARLARIYGIVVASCDTSTRLAIIEDLPTHGMGAGKTGMAQGVVRLALHAAHVPYVSVPPATLKKYATGSGNAGKADMRMALYQRAGLDLRDDNQVDAYWLMALGYQLLAQPLITVPAAQVKALAKLRLPMAVAA